VKDPAPRPPSCFRLVRTFLRISLLGFGGPNAHLALMMDEVVDRKGWITREHFMHLVGVTNLLPGPNSSEVAIHIGHTQRGWRGSLATGLAFLLPTLVLVTVFSALYFRFGTLPTVEVLFWGLKPAILAVILAAGWKLGKTALGIPEQTSYFLLVLAVGGLLTAFFLDRLEVPAMVLGGIAGWVVLHRRANGSIGEGGGPSLDPGEGSEGPARANEGHPEVEPEGGRGHLRSSGFLLPLAASSGAAGWMTVPSLGLLGQLFLLTAGAGAALFGGGYMLVALLEPFVVESYGWLTPDQFLDGIALTQAVPGPIVTLVAFVGYGVAGVPGALVATFGIYLPSFAAVLLVAPHLERWRRVESFRWALKGVNAVVAGAILGVGLALLRPGLPDRWAAVLFLVALWGMIRLRLPAVWVVAGGLGAGLLRLVLLG